SGPHRGAIWSLAGVRRVNVDLVMRNVRGCAVLPWLTSGLPHDGDQTRGVMTKQSLSALVNASLDDCIRASAISRRYRRLQAPLNRDAASISRNKAPNRYHCDIISIALARRSHARRSVRNKS